MTRIVRVQKSVHFYLALQLLEQRLEVLARLVPCRLGILTVRGAFLGLGTRLELLLPFFQHALISSGGNAVSDTIRA